MKRYLPYPLLALWLTLACTACGDDYHYPPAVLEYLTAETDANGAYRTVVTDAGRTLPVLDDRTSKRVRPDTTYRIVSNYEHVTANDGTEGVRLYAVLNAIAPVPATAGHFEKGVRTDVCHEVLSHWRGYGYLNVVVLVRQQGSHSFHFVEDSVRVSPGGTRRSVYLTLYHEAANELQDYEKRAYLSIPVHPYLSNGISRLDVFLRINTDKGMALLEMNY